VDQLEFNGVDIRSMSVEFAAAITMYSHAEEARLYHRGGMYLTHEVQIRVFGYLVDIFSSLDRVLIEQ